MALHALVCAARDNGDVPFNDMAIQYRNDYLGMVRDEGRDADREAGRLGLDEVREHLARTVLPRLAQDGLVMLPAGQIGSDTTISIEPSLLEPARPISAGDSGLGRGGSAQAHGRARGRARRSAESPARRSRVEAFSKRVRW